MTPLNTTLRKLSYFSLNYLKSGAVGVMELRILQHGSVCHTFPAVSTVHCPPKITDVICHDGGMLRWVDYVKKIMLGYCTITEGEGSVEED